VQEYMQGFNYPKLTISDENFVHQGFLDVKEMANVLDRITLTTVDWNVLRFMSDTSLAHSISELHAYSWT
jgi:hypothetical protein